MAYRCYHELQSWESINETVNRLNLLLYFYAITLLGLDIMDCNSTLSNAGAISHFFKFCNIDPLLSLPNVVTCS